MHIHAQCKNNTAFTEHYAFLENSNGIMIS